MPFLFGMELVQETTINTAAHKPDEKQPSFSERVLHRDAAECIIRVIFDPGELKCHWGYLSLENHHLWFWKVCVWTGNKLRTEGKSVDMSFFFCLAFAKYCWCIRLFSSWLKKTASTKDCRQKCGCVSANTPSSWSVPEQCTMQGHRAVLEPARCPPWLLS